VKAAARVVASSATAVMLVATAVGCGSKEAATTTSSAQALKSWANGLCGSLVTWQSSVEAAGTKLKGESVTKANLEAAYTSVSTATDKLAADVKALGKPPTPAAEEADAAVEQLTGQLSNSVDQIKKATSGLSGTNEVLGAVSVVSTELVQMGNDIKSTTNSLKSMNGKEDWQKAFDEAPECGTLSG
jgi:cell division protein ZapA (FtsZ GTPase activity inhibitor)